MSGQRTLSALNARCWWLRGIRVTAVSILAFCTWKANEAVCPACASEDLSLATADGSTVRARLYVPDSSERPLPAAVVLHGYLANLAFMEVPWAADLTRLGLVLLFVNRRGHGGSSGSLWPPRNELGRLADVDSDVHAGLDYLRSRPDLVDPARIALVGHSHGGTGAITAASADWTVNATVALSASLAPWQYVNHVAPRNLLLVYGRRDHFVLHDTDRMLIANATRGYLKDAGQVGDLQKGTARRLLRVDSGHVDVLYDSSTQREVLAWLKASLNASGPIVLSPARRLWIAGGFAAILITLAAGGIRTGARSQPALRPSIRTAWYGTALVFLWILGLASAGTTGRWFGFFPGRETSNLAALLVCEAIVLGASFALARMLTAFKQTPVGLDTAGLQSAGRAVVAALAVIGALRSLCTHFYASSFDRQRLSIFILFASLGILIFAILNAWTDRIGRSAGATLILLLATATVAAAGTIAERMAVLPIYVFAAALVLHAAYRSGTATGSRGSPLFSGLVLGWSAATVCALY